MPSEYVQRLVQRLLGDAEEAASRGDWDKVRDIAHRIDKVDLGNGDAAALVALAAPGKAASAGDIVAIAGMARVSCHRTDGASRPLQRRFSTRRLLRK